MSTPTTALPVTEQPATTPRTMQAVVFDDFGGPEVLVAREIPVPEVRPHDLLVRNASIGVNRADLLHRKGAYGRAYFGDADTMGLEIAGTVVAMGPEVQGFALGDRVMGIVGGGAYAELSRIDHRMAMPVPAGMDLVAAGAVAEVFVTARVRHGGGRQAQRCAGLRGRCVHRLPQRRLSGGGGAGHAGPGRGCGDRLHRGSVPAAQRAVAGRRGAPGVGGAAGGRAGCGAAHGCGAVPPPADLRHRDEVPRARGQAGHGPAVCAAVAASPGQTG